MLNWVPCDSTKLPDMTKTVNKNEASLRTQPMSLFPTLSSEQEAIELMESKLPITSKNELYALLMTFRNTVLAQASRF